MTDPTTEELRIAQLQRERSERERAEREREIDPEGVDTTTESHDRRADKAAYLREKLEERARAEREKDGEQVAGRPQQAQPWSAASVWAVSSDPR